MPAVGKGRAPPGRRPGLECLTDPGGHHSILGKALQKMPSVVIGGIKGFDAQHLGGDVPGRTESRYYRKQTQFEPLDIPFQR